MSVRSTSALATQRRQRRNLRQNTWFGVQSDQRTSAITTRLDLTRTPTLSFQLYAQPFFTAGDYGDLFKSRSDNTFLIEGSYWLSP